MSKKIKKARLSDEMLDNVAGGVLTLGGQAVSEFGECEFDDGSRGVYFTTSEGTFGVEFDDATKAKIAANPSAKQQVFNELLEKHNSGSVFKVEDFMTG